MNEEPKAARESYEASWKSLEESLAAVEREAKIMAERVRRNVILDLLKYARDPDERRVIEEVSGRMLRGGTVTEGGRDAQMVISLPSPCSPAAPTRYLTDYLPEHITSPGRIPAK